MGKEESIALRLQTGATPRQLVLEGYRKSTVYKVAESLRSQRSAAPTPPITVQMAADRERYLPGESAFLAFTIGNHSANDLYVFQVGARPEWMSATDWIPTVVRRLLSPGETLAVRITVPIPSDIPLGENDLLFGIQGQWVGPQTGSPANELMWVSGLVLRVQQPQTSAKVLIAHSVTDLSLVRQLARTLEDNGITALIPETEADVRTFLANGADFIVAVANHPGRLGLVSTAIEQGQRVDPEMILLRDIWIASSMPPALAALAWADVDFAAGAAAVMTQVVQYVTNTIASRCDARKKDHDNLVGVLMAGVAALAVGIAIAKGGSGAA